MEQLNEPLVKNDNLEGNRSASGPISRRRFLCDAMKGLGAASLLGALPRGWVGSVYASDAPETTTMRFGIIALTDCSPIVIAHEKGFFKKYGINSVVAKGANWAAIRDSLEARLRAHLKEDDPYLQTVSQRWQDGIVKLVNEMPAPDFSKPALGFATAA